MVRDKETACFPAVV